jgi:hypothetical protein
MRPYLLRLIESLADQGHAASSAESISWAAHREAEKLADITMVDELADAARSDPSKHRRAGCYFVIGKIGHNLQDARCASVLLGLLAAEKDKNNIASLLNRVGEIPKRAELDLAAVYALLRDGRWRVRHAAIRALDNSASPDVEDRLLKHLVETEDPVDQTYCHAVLNHIGTPRSIPAVEVNLKSRKIDVKMSAESALRAIRMRHGL